MTDTTSHGETLPDGSRLVLGEGRTPILESPGRDVPAKDVREALGRHGAVLVRGLGLATPADLAAVAHALDVTPMRERESFAARDDLGHGVYSASLWPVDEPMCMHHELSYAAEVPGTALFGCLRAPRSGGATGVADARAVLDALPAELVEPFERDGWLLARHYGDVGLGWPQAFGTEDADEVSAYCRQHALDHRWMADGSLHTVQRRSAVVRHPASEERLWFNQIAFLNELTMDPAVREYLLSLYGPNALPFTTRYGDGTAIPESVIETINATYTAATAREPWQTGDVLVVDNLRMAHSREAYEGERDVVALFGDPTRLPGHARPATTG
ncbi:TauD/TfdA family dioxygenase [Streptomyces luteogriseus]|uniref:Alpha-ketoglutarate-dependent taurine dioxygenase n=1 Tax=Streptomyces luteogriseus TaxID=68233 RepID=A0A7W7GLA1_9ACTN|nr:TauD/TfdA family dioxygenase [Streptomyces luteogriseus]MBB4717829.1 alpha-ketoglutarate-dependent taurine dioxygenase [Streptomyces luteogriseus]